ncbi:2-oxoglutarate (2OG) and Fe(II)-dependent oxygenase superfamily protein [Striga asiatica]|uniref:2-oxoglutarate (2OG) and Fe(II)-dependent oxygenase superfamily protein n=1 Tax=Striga asiatica TaxID=4170 RepID=A0A5A7QWJ0_STRAF|nr:2-oxoglutarate (2OG) and Fe(II)-dependent oxygenase superfamily protein [Striga asiatica]
MIVWYKSDHSNALHTNKLIAHVAGKQPVGNAQAWPGLHFHNSVSLQDLNHGPCALSCLPTTSNRATTHSHKDQSWQPLSISHHCVHLQESCDNLVRLAKRCDVYYHLPGHVDTKLAVDQIWVRVATF